ARRPVDEAADRARRDSTVAARGDRTRPVRALLRFRLRLTPRGVPGKWCQTPYFLRDRPSLEAFVHNDDPFVLEDLHVIAKPSRVSTGLRIVAALLPVAAVAQPDPTSPPPGIEPLPV